MLFWAALGFWGSVWGARMRIHRVPYGIKLPPNDLVPSPFGGGEGVEMLLLIISVS
jgi:hypothetical protein